MIDEWMMATNDMYLTLIGEASLRYPDLFLTMTENGY
jgi:hypothetical protein